MLGRPSKTWRQSAKAEAVSPSHEFLRRNDQIAVRCRKSRVGDGLKLIDLDRYLLRSLSGEFFRFRDNDRDRHSLKMHLAVSEQRLIRYDAADLILADDVFCGDDSKTPSDFSASVVSMLFNLP